MKKKKTLLGNFNWRRFIVILSVFTVITFLPIAVYLYLARTIQSVAHTVVEDFSTLDLIDQVNSSNYDIGEGTVKVSKVSFGTGNDGICTVSVNTNINTGSCVGRVDGDAVNFSVTENVVAGSDSITLSSVATGLSIGDEILIINLQGTQADHSNVGQYETAYVENVVGEILSLDRNLTNGYNGTTQKIMVQRIPQYSDVTVNAGVNWYPDAWDGTKGGVFSFEASGVVNVNGNIDVSALGYRGGNKCAVGACNTTPGEGYFPVSGNDGKGGATGAVGYAGSWSGGGGGGSNRAGGAGSNDYGSVGGGGGGSTNTKCTTNDCDGLGGGGGGGGYGTPGVGGYSRVTSGDGGTSSASGAGGAGALHYGDKRYSAGGGGGGKSAGEADLSRLNFGGGGGGGGAGQGLSGSYYDGTSGSRGGGIIFILGTDINVLGSIKSNGGNITAEPESKGSGGGTGAGGAIKIVGGQISLSESSTTASAGVPSTRGVAGGDGRVRIEYTTSFNGNSTPVASSQVSPAYANSMTLQSSDLISEENNVFIQSFSYTLSSKPVGTSASIQFSTDSLMWFDSSGIEDGDDELILGENVEIILEELDLQTSEFYYKISFDTNSGQDTPVLEGVSLTYSTAPEVPTMGTPEALSTSVIRWHFSDNANNEEGFALYDEEDNLIKYCLGEDLTYCDETGLDENTQYSRKITAYNSSGESAPSELAYVYTLLSPPTILEGGEKTVSTINLSALGQINGSEIYFDCENTGCDTGINEWISTSSDEVTNLDFNTAYTFRVKGRNGDGVETEYSESITIYTLAEVPSISLSPLSSSSVSLTAEGVNNINDGNSGVFFECEELDCNEGISVWTQSESTAVTNLEPNTLYFFRVKSRNYNGIETTFSEYIGTYTKSDIPNVPVLIARTINSITVALSQDNNPVGTQYAIMEESTNKYVDISTGALVDEEVWGTYTQFGSENGKEVVGLEVGTEYRFKVKSRNEADIESEFSQSVTVATKLYPPTLLSALTTTASSFTWRVTDSNASKVGYKIYDSNNNLLITCSVNSMNQCIEGNLSSNTEYARKVKVYSNISESDYSNTFLFSTHSEPSRISSVTATGASSVRLAISGSSRDSLQIVENKSNRYYNNDLKILMTSSSITPFSSSIDIDGLLPNTEYEFKVRSLNKKNVATTWSTNQSIYTFAQSPSMVRVNAVSSDSARVYINTLDNPADTELLIRENNSGRYLDFELGTLTVQEKWGTFSNFGSANGVIVNGLETGVQYGFSVKARNKSLVQTGWSDPIFIGTGAILRNIDSTLRATLATQENIDLTVRNNAQFGERNVRIKKGDLLVADIPVLFNQDRDWQDAIILSAPEERKTVIKLQENHGVSNPFTMYVNADDTNAFLLCPGASQLEEVKEKCSGAVQFTGEFPSKKNVGESSVTVSKVVIGGINYWVADGLRGTGGLGFYYEEPKDTKVDKPVVEEKKEESKSEKAVPKQSTIQKITNFIKDNTLGILINTDVVTNLEERELRTISTTANVVTVTVGATALFGGLTQLGYMVSQFMMLILSSLGFRKKRVNYGFVYDSNTKEPVHMALVRVFNTKDRLVDTAVTDINGRFSASLGKGKYLLKVSKSGYEYPSIYVKGPHDYPLQNVYTGSLDISSEDTDIQIAVPIDPKEILGGQMVFHRIKNILVKALSILNVFIFIVGVTISSYTYYTHRNSNNLIFLLLYIIPLYILINSFFNKKGKYGKVVDEKGKPLSNISITIREKEFNKVIAKRVTNSKGKYRFILDKGKYELDIAEKGWELVDIKRGTFIDVRKDNYILAERIKVKKS
jgi:hypothetical protein